MKKVFAILLCLIMCFSSVSVLAYFDYTDVDEEYVEITDLLYDLEIMEGFDDGSFNPDDTLTRAEVATIMVRLIGKGKNWLLARNNFTDVPYSHWAAKYITCAYENGIINGMGDGTFDPEGEVAFHQAVKMLVCVLGYEPVALANGGWIAGGYLAAGSVAGFTKCVSGWVSENGINAPVTRLVMAQMLYNSLDVELFNIDSFSTGITGTDCYPDKGETILTKYFGCQEFEGIVTNFSEIENKIQIVITDCDYSSVVWDLKIGQRRELINCDRNAKAFLGYSIAGYFKEGKFLKGATQYRNEIFTLTGDDIKEFTSDKVVYYKERESDWTDEFEIENYIAIINFDPIWIKCNVIVNGELNPDFDVYEEYKNLDDITFLDNDDDGDFEFIIVNTEKQQSLSHCVTAPFAQGSLFLWLKRGKEYVKMKKNAKKRTNYVQR